MGGSERAKHNFMVPLRPHDVLQFSYRNSEWKKNHRQAEQSRSFCIYPLHYNIINHRDKEKARTEKTSEKTKKRSKGKKG